MYAKTEQMCIRDRYESGISHDAACERVADAILGGMPDNVAFEPADAAAIKTAILGHRKDVYKRQGSSPASDTIAFEKPLRRLFCYR